MIIKHKSKQNNINIEPDCYKNINNINIDIDDDINDEILTKLNSKKEKNEIIYIIKNTDNDILANKIINYLDSIDYIPNIIIINYCEDIPVFYLKTFFVINNINDDFSIDSIIETLIANKKYENDYKI